MRERKKERKRDYGPHSARGSAEPYVSVSLPFPSLSSNHHPLILPSTTSDKETVLRIIPQPFWKKTKTRPLTRYQKRTVLFFFLQNLKLVLYGSLRIHATSVVLHVMQVLPPTVLPPTCYSTGTIRSGRYLLVVKVVQFDLTQNLAVRTPFPFCKTRYKTTIYLILACLT